VPKITKLCVNLSKLCLEYCGFFSGHSVVVAAAVVLAAVVGQYYHPRCAVCSVFKVTRTEPLPIITKYKYNFT